MCFTAVKDKDLNKINDGVKKYTKLRLKNPEKFRASYSLSAFNHDNLPVITPERELDFFSWGFIQPTKSDDKESAEIKFMTANAKAETIFEKKLYKEAILNKRCIIALDGFYEWRHVLGKKFPHYIYSRIEPVFYIGGIYNEFKNPDTGEVKNTVSMITTDANPMMAEIHNMKKRMPFILPTEKIMEWINPGLSQEEIMKLMKPYDENLMAFHTVGKKPNPISEESIQPVIYPELTNEQQALFE